MSAEPLLGLRQPRWVPVAPLRTAFTLLTASLGPAARLLQADKLMIMLLNLASIVALAILLAGSVERLAKRIGALGGSLLVATLANVVELIFSLLALQDGNLRFVQVTLLGTVLTNLLLIPGICFVVRGVSTEREKLNKHSGALSAMVLLLAATAVAVPTAYNGTVDRACMEGCEKPCSMPQTLVQSRLVAVVLLVGYLTSIVWSLATHSHLVAKVRSSYYKYGRSPNNGGINGGASVAGRSWNSSAVDLGKLVQAESAQALPYGLVTPPSLEAPSVTPPPSGSSADSASDKTPGREDSPDGRALAVGAPDAAEAAAEGGVAAQALGGGAAMLVALTVLTCWIVVCADSLLDSLDTASRALGLSEHFAALVLLPNVGGVDAIVASVFLAHSGSIANLELALGLAIGSAMQILCGLLPLLILVGWAIGAELTLDFRPFEAILLLLAVLSLNAIVRRASATYLEGVVLGGLYLIIATSYFFRGNEARSEWPYTHIDVDDPDEDMARGGICICGEPCCGAGENLSCHFPY